MEWHVTLDVENFKHMNNERVEGLSPAGRGLAGKRNPDL